MTTIAPSLIHAREFYDALDKVMDLAPKVGLSWIRVETAGGNGVDRSMRIWGTAPEHSKSCDGSAARALLAEWLETELDPEDDEYGPWMESFTARAVAALEGSKP